MSGFSLGPNARVFFGPGVPLGETEDGTLVSGDLEHGVGPMIEITSSITSVRLTKREDPTMGTTTDPTDPRLGHGVDTTPQEKPNDAYLVLSEEEIAKGLTRPLRTTYVHTAGAAPCGTVTSMSLPIAQTFARQPSHYGATWCTGCKMHLPVEEFTWERDGQVVGS